MTYEQLVKEIKKRHRRAEFEYNEKIRESEIDPAPPLLSAQYAHNKILYAKGVMETLESLVNTIDAAEYAEKQRAKHQKKGKK